MKNKGFWRRGCLMQLVAFWVLFVGVVSAQAWDISGTVTNYDATRTGRVYLYLQQQFGGDTGLGVSIPAPASNTPFTIRGVPNGDYILKAFVDGSGTGRLHANDPTWGSGTITIYNAPYTLTSNTTVMFATHSPVAPLWAGMNRRTPAATRSPTPTGSTTQQPNPYRQVALRLRT